MPENDYLRHPGQKANALCMPKHVAIIMDGNGRWAKKRGLPRITGHHKGRESVRCMVKACIQRGIPTLTLFAFGKENWKRPPREVRHLFRLFYVVLHREIKELAQEGVRLKILGDLKALPETIQKAIVVAQAKTQGNDKLHLNIMLNYSGRWDIHQALDKAMQKQKNPHEAFEQALCLHGQPEPDLMIRTAGVQRVSNFLLWDLAYTELYFTPTFWPDFDERQLDKAIQFFQTQERRFGLISEQVEQVHA